MASLLIVDDEWLIRNGIVQMVKRLAPEWSVEEACNGQEAFECIRRSSIDLVFCDIKMPGTDGMKMLEWLNRDGIRVPVVFLTGYDDFHLMRNALRLRAYDYILKPVHDNDIMAVLAHFKKDFMNIKRLTNRQHTRLQKFEFALLNALDALDGDKVSRVIGDGRLMLGDCLSVKEYVDEVIRIADQFFAKNRMPGFQKDVTLSSNDLSNLSNVQHAIQIRIARLTEEAGAGNDRIINMAKEYIESRLHRSLSLTEVANHVHFNPTYFSEYFKEKCGETFSGYVTRMKIEKAKQMLEDPANKIIDISERLGYRDPRSFTKMFKMVLGMTPKEYRKSRA